jgi:eukaryotic-like serine/threonine-protein kinase
VAGEVIGGYRLRTLLQSGQQSQVYEVVEVTSNRHFAMKILLPEAAARPEARKLLYHEAEVGKLMTHQNVIRIHKINRDNVHPFFVMEYFPSGSLRTRQMNKQFDFIKEHAHSIFRQAATGLAYMNSSGWLHRDVKPDNILANSAGEVRLIDFAISEKIPTGLGKMFYRRSKAAGTPSYMSPEQIRRQALDPRADIYSFGCTVYEIVCGKPPYRGSSIQDLLSRHFTEKPLSPVFHNSDITDEFAALVMHMLAKKKEDRPKDFHQVLIALRGMRVYKSQPVKGKEEEGM